MDQSIWNTYQWYNRTSLCNIDQYVLQYYLVHMRTLPMVGTKTVVWQYTSCRLARSGRRISNSKRLPMAMLKALQMKLVALLGLQCFILSINDHSNASWYRALPLRDPTPFIRQQFTSGQLDQQRIPQIEMAAAAFQKCTAEDRLRRARVLALDSPSSPPLPSAHFSMSAPRNSLATYPMTRTPAARTPFASAPPVVDPPPALPW
jgi:hypothetical protein